MRLHKMLLIIGLILTPLIIFKKKPYKRWVTVFVITAISSGITDYILVRKGYLKYPTKLLDKYFNISILFDFIYCPLLNVVYHQISHNDRPLMRVLKVFLITVPQLLLELFFERNTSFLKFKNGWNWKHTFLGMNIKYLAIRILMS